MTSSRNFGNLKELLQLEAIGTSVGSNHYRVLLPALPCARLVLYCHSAHINYLSKPSNAMQVFFLKDSDLSVQETLGEVLGLRPRPRLLSSDGSFRIANRLRQRKGISKIIRK